MHFLEVTSFYYHFINSQPLFNPRKLINLPDCDSDRKGLEWSFYHLIKLSVHFRNCWKGIVLTESSAMSIWGKVEILLWKIELHNETSIFSYESRNILWKVVILLWTVEIYHEWSNLRTAEIYCKTFRFSYERSENITNDRYLL